jgi:hypothetical protein
VPNSSSQKSPVMTAVHEISPDAMPNTVPICSAGRRPRRRASMPTGSVPSHMPSTMQVMGSVASPLSGAITEPTMLAVEKMMVLLAPPSACAADSTMALRRASASSTVACWKGSAMADISGLSGKSRLF